MFVAVANAQHEPQVPWSFTGLSTWREAQLKEEGKEERRGGEMGW